MLDVQLTHYQEFKDTLKNYEMSGRAKEILANIPFVLMVAPSSTGRNTIIRHLVDRYDYYFVISDTTRPPQERDGKLEQNGVNYFFRTEEEILADLKAGEFLEAALIHEQQVSGISIRELKKAKQLNKVAITDIEIVGTDNVMKANPNTKAIFLVPPTYEEWHRRIISRGRMTPKELENRLRSADREFRAALERPYYNFVVAEDIDHTAAIVDSIAKGHANPHQEKGQKLIQDLHKQLQEKLHIPIIL